MSSSVLQLYTKGARIWVPDPALVWIEATVIKNCDGKELCLETKDMAQRVIKLTSEKDLPHLRNPEILVGVNDLTSLSYLHEPAVLHNLSVRFLQKQAIYTYCGIVLVAINPYEDLPIYANDTIYMYRGKNMGDLDPHIYAVAEEAFARMERNNLNQSIIVSGESGAGKTVSAKYAMRYFATVGGTSQTETQVEKRVLASSPIMEAIGNAKTTRNDNSSRFGKYIEIDFNKNFHIIGANMRTYLLEKSRVVFQAPDERNYHIFYQMCCARDLPQLKELLLEDSEHFEYLSQGGNPVIDGVDDTKEFVATHEAFSMLGFSDNEQNSILRILSAILHLGNVVFEPGTGRADSETCYVPGKNESLKKFAQLLQIKEEHIRKWLVNRRIVTVRETLEKPMNQDEAVFARDALAKCIYSRLFDWIVVQINKALRTSGKIHKFIGVLDIYGFETFEVNSFEQFCINYANEKLQQQFNQHVFKLEQEEYLREGIEWKMIDFYDNQPCIDLIESKLGIYDLLDEECRMPKGSDQSWVQKLYDKCRTWDHFQKPRLSQTSFMVRHFADQVEYQCEGFLDKNRDTVMEEQIQILKASNNDLVSDLFLESGKAVSGKQTQGSRQLHQNLNKKTVGSQFRDSLQLLMQTLNDTTPHYVRCIKPNDSKLSFDFDPKRAVQQLRACGVLETVRISAAGFPSRWTYHDFFLRYRVLCCTKDVDRSDFRVTCTVIISKLIDDNDKYQFGKSKLFFRAGQVAYLEKLRSEKLRACGIMISKHFRGWMCRKKYQQKRSAALVIQRYVRGFLARRRVQRMRRHKAAILLQRHIRGWIKRTQYRRLKAQVISLQAQMRGHLARQRHQAKVRHVNAVLIQAHVRGWLCRTTYTRQRRQVILVQSLVRRFLAKRQYKKLKIEARSIEHQKKLNKGLENKIISLQQKLTDSERSLSELKRVRDEHRITLKELEDYKLMDVKNKAATSRVESLERELDSLRQILNVERAEKVDLINEKERESALFRAKEAGLNEEVAKLREHLAMAQDKLATQTQSEELLQKLEAEKADIHAEYEQERIAYQKLLKSYNRLEAQYDNVQDELSHLRGHDVSMMSIDTLHDDESAYGSQSGRCSSVMFPLPSSTEPEQDNAVAVMVRLQRKLKETQMAKDKLERKVDELEANLVREKNNNNSKGLSVADNLKLQEFEIENSKLKENMKKLQDTLAETVSDERTKGILELYEHLQDEVERRQEECIQLRTVLAGVSIDGQPLSSDDIPEAEELITAFETQKRVIHQLQEQLSEEKGQFKELHSKYKEELAELTKTCSEQQQLINQAISNPAANNTEACLQHEITRLTGENFDLREKIDNLQDDIKRLKRLLKAYMKKSSSASANSDASVVLSIPDLDDQFIDPEQTHTSMMPTIRKKDSVFLGIIEYKREHEPQIFKALIYDLKPKLAVQMLPGLPAYLLFMMIRYTDYINDDKAVRSLIQSFITQIKKVIKRKGLNDLEIKTLWLGNTLRLHHNLMQYSGESQFQTESTPKQVEQCLRNFDLSEYGSMFTDVAVWLYQGMTKLMEEEIQPLIVPAILEHEEIRGIAGNKEQPQLQPTWLTDSDGTMHVDPHQASERLLRLLNRFHNIMSQHGLEPDVIAQLFKQMFYFICAGALNNLLLRKDMCHWSKGMQIRYNVAQLEQWARDKKIHDTIKVIDSLAPIIQAAQLLQARKSDADVDAICELCDRLRVSQIIKILNLYTPGDEFEEKVSPAFVRKIQAKLSDRNAQEMKGENTLLMDTKFAFPIKFLFYPSAIQLEELDIPDFNSLNKLLKKI